MLEKYRIVFNKPTIFILTKGYVLAQLVKDE